MFRGADEGRDLEGHSGNDFLPFCMGGILPGGQTSRVISEDRQAFKDYQGSGLCGKREVVGYSLGLQVQGTGSSGALTDSGSEGGLLREFSLERRLSRSFRSASIWAAVGAPANCCRRD